MVVIRTAVTMEGRTGTFRRSMEMTLGTVNIVAGDEDAETH